MPDHASDHKGHRERLRKKYRTAGIDAFHDYEAVELLLSFAIRRGDVKPPAKALLKAFGSIKGIIDADMTDLEKVYGVGPDSAVGLKLIKDLCSLYLRQQAEEKPQITCTSELVNYCKAILGGMKDEQFRVIYLNAQNRIIDDELIQEGIVNQAVVYPRKVLENALKRKASAIILLHNHPSGHIRPSDADIRLTRTIQDTAKVLDILVHDHIIIGENRFFSFREEGIMS
ncbi:MAG: DNA repair protein RadC [Deltaproteobacteria bacterium]|nr:DNA repair protein RadC [Deltaproteobacteria bacterium]